MAQMTPLHEKMAALLCPFVWRLLATSRGPAHHWHVKIKNHMRYLVHLMAYRICHVVIFVLRCISIPLVVVNGGPSHMVMMTASYSSCWIYVAPVVAVQLELPSRRPAAIYGSFNGKRQRRP